MALLAKCSLVTCEYDITLRVLYSRRLAVLLFLVCVVTQEAVKVLLAHGADASIRNHEGQAVTEFDDVPAELLALF